MAGQRATWRSPELGEARHVDVPQGRVRFQERGSGPPLVFLHGALVNSNLWRKVVPPLAPDFRCITPDLPLGGHIVPLEPDADLSPAGLTNLIADAIEALGLEDVTLIANDTADALAQLVVTRRPESIGRLVLTSGDAFDNFPPKLMQPMMPILRVPGVFRALLAPFRFERPRRLFMGSVAKRPIDREAEESYALPPIVNSGIRHDARKAFLGLNPRHTLEAAERLPGFDRPVLIAWSREDKFFPREHAERLADLFPDARLEWIDDSYSFSPEDQPERLAELIAGFVREPVPAAH